MRAFLSLLLWFFGLIYVLFFLIFAISCTFVTTPEKYDKWLKKLLKVLLKFIGIRITVEGLEHINLDETYLFMANHVSIFDIPVLGGYIPHIVRGVEAKRQFKWPIYGYAIRRLGNIPMDRKSIHESIKSANIASEKLKNGHSMVILPEGHRTLNGQLKPFKKLPFRLAKDSGRPIVPIGLSGLFSVKRKGSWMIHPGSVKVKFGIPIDSYTISELSVEELRDHVKNSIENLIEFY